MRLNLRFRAGHASSVLAEAGVVMHQFDNYEDGGSPWMCGSTGQFAGRMSCFVAFRNMRLRRDRVAVCTHGPIELASDFHVRM